MAIDYEKDCQWFEERCDELMEEYAGKAIAVVNESVFHSDEDYDRFLEYLRKHGIDPSQVCVEVFPEEDAAYIL